MQAIKRILVDLDPTKDQQPALSRAIYLAKCYQSSITLFVVAYNRGIVSNLFFNPMQLEQAKEAYLKTQYRWLESYLTSAMKEGIDADAKVAWGKPIYEVINQQAQQGDYDLIIKSTHHHPLVNKLLFTPNDWQLLKTAQVPIIMAKESQQNQYQNIMAAIDSNTSHEYSAKLNQSILNQVKALSKRCESSAHAVHCYDPIPYQLWTDISIGMGAGMGPADFTMGQDNYDSYVEQLMEQNKKEFFEQIEALDFPKENLHLQEGYPEKELPQIVDELDVDLLVMGTSYHSGLIGSTIEKVLDDVNCDLMAIPVSE